MSNAALTAVVLAMLLLHVGAQVAALIPRRKTTPLLAVNLVVSIAMLLLLGSNLSVLGRIDGPVLGGVAFESAALVLALSGLAGKAFARRLSVAIFIVYLLASGAATIFVLTFKMTRLI